MNRCCCVAPFSIVRERFGRVKTTLRRCAVLTRPARSQEAGNYWSDAVKDQHGSNRPPCGTHRGALFARSFARLVSSRDLIWRQPDDSAFPPHGNWIAVSFMASKGITNGCAERALDTIKIAGPFGGSLARIWNGHACNSFRDFHASASATTAEPPKA